MGITQARPMVAPTFGLVGERLTAARALTATGLIELSKLAQQTVVLVVQLTGVEEVVARFAPSEMSIHAVGVWNNQ